MTKYNGHGSKAIKCFSCANLATCPHMQQTYGANCEKYITAFLNGEQVMELLNYKGNISYFSNLLQSREQIEQIAEKIKAKVSPEYRVIVLIMPANTRFVLKEVVNGDPDPRIIYQKECPNYYKQDDKEKEITRFEAKAKKKEKK